MKIALGVSGGIAAYKSAELTRLLVKDGHEVHCILTEHATQFITPLTLATLSGRPALTGNFEASESGVIEHIRLAEEADLILIAPATANVLAKLAHGIADDLLTTTALAAQRLTAVAPAMNVFMWENAATCENVRALESRGVAIIGPAAGSLACGYEAEGRMEEPAAIAARVRALLKRSGTFAGMKILITAGPTREHFDPVRFISNPSSGKMGYALARAALQHGASVSLVSGPTGLAAPYGARVTRVTSADEMRAAVEAEIAGARIFISAAAVSDWKPKTYQKEKQKKSAAEPVIELSPTPDILAAVSRNKNGKILVGFAAESERLDENAKEKLEKKNLDLIVGNLIAGDGPSAFGSDENEIKLFFRSGEVKALPRMSKLEAAHAILEAIATLR